LRKILQDKLRENRLQVFAPIAKTAGFLRVLADIIYELKQNRVYPDIYLQAATSPKDRELAEIYASYQEIMQDHKLVDREGEGWLALEAVGKERHLARDVDLLLVDGYDQFTP